MSQSTCARESICCKCLDLLGVKTDTQFTCTVIKQWPKKKHCSLTIFFYHRTEAARANRINIGQKSETRMFCSLFILH